MKKNIIPIIIMKQKIILQMHNPSAIVVHHSTLLSLSLSLFIFIISFLTVIVFLILLCMYAFIPFLYHPT